MFTMFPNLVQHGSMQTFGKSKPRLMGITLGIISKTKVLDELKFQTDDGHRLNIWGIQKVTTVYRETDMNTSYIHFCSSDKMIKS